MLASCPPAAAARRGSAGAARSGRGGSRGGRGSWSWGHVDIIIPLTISSIDLRKLPTRHNPAGDTVWSSPAPACTCPGWSQSPRSSASLSSDQPGVKS